MEEDEDFQSDENIETILDVESFEDQDTMFYKNYDNSRETNSQYEFPQYSIVDDSLIVIDDDEDDEDDYDSTSSDSREHIQVRKRLNESTSAKLLVKKIITADEIEDNTEIEICDQQVPNKRRLVSAVVNTSKNTNSTIRQEKKDKYLHLEQIAVMPKINPYISKLSSTVNSNQNKRSPSVLPSTILMKPTNTINRLQSNSSFPEISCKKSFSKPKITSINKSKSEDYVMSHGMKYLLRNENSRELKSQSFKSYPSLTSTVKGNNTIAEASEQKKKPTIEKTNVTQNDDTNRYNNDFIACMKQLPDGKFKMVPAQGKVPADLEKVFKRNSHFVKQKLVRGSTSNTSSNCIHGEKPSVSTYSMPSSNETNNFSHDRQVLSGKSSQTGISKSNEFGNVKIKNNKFIPHTATSKDAIEYHRNIKTGNGEIKIKTIRNVCNSAGFIPLSLNSESLDQLSQPLSRKYTTRYDSFNKSKTKLNAKNTNESNLSTPIIHNNDDSNKTTTSTDEILEVFTHEMSKSNDIIKLSRDNKEHSNKQKTILKEIYEDQQNEVSEEEDNDKYGKFICCHYEYCDTITHEPELIDNLYCSLRCKQLDSNNVAAIEEPIIKLKETIKPPKLPKVDRKELLEKLENRIHKRKQSLTSSNSEKLINEDWDTFEQLENASGEPSIDENQSPLNSPHQISASPEANNENQSPFNSPHQISSPEANNDYNDEDEDDDDQDNPYYIHFEAFISDKKLINYMEEMQFRSAHLKLFDKPFPNEKNYFEEHQKLEAIDPEHQALFCAMTVAEVRGYRIKLHFDGYPSEYDFWVNANNPDIFYATWCQRNMRSIEPPKGYDKPFDWIPYLKVTHTIPSSKHFFASTKNLVNCDKHKFIIGAKLEALDKLTRTLPKQLICVATVADILGNRIRIHFDGWTDNFDYWTDITSTNIHPIKWCENNGRSLSPPSGYNDFKGKKPFTWNEYLHETKSTPVPEDAFNRRPLRDFANEMTIEVVDLVIPSLIRVAVVVDVRGDELKILYDGFHSNYAYWVEDDSPDIHPVGWCVKTNHPVELPPDKLWTCKVMGCSGKGNSNTSKSSHFVLNDCPYELDSWKKAVAGLNKLPDRLMFNVSNTNSVPSLSVLSNPSLEIQVDENKRKCKINTNMHDDMIEDNATINDNKLDNQDGNNAIRLEHIGDNQAVLDKRNNAPIIDSKQLRKHICLSLLGHDLGSLSYSNESRSWTRYNAQLGLPLCNDDVRKWSTEEVASYVNRVVNANSGRCHTEQISLSDRFRDQKIDGETFLMLTQEELLNILKMPLGQAIKLINAIIMLRQRISAFEDFSLVT